MTTPLLRFGNYSRVDGAYVEAMMREALAEAQAAGKAGEYRSAPSSHSTAT
jgi:hypothetical protein